MEPALKHCLSLSIGWAMISWAAIYVLVYFLFAIHEEIGISADAALSLALWNFPIVFPGSLVFGLVRKAHPPRRNGDSL